MKLQARSTIQRLYQLSSQLTSNLPYTRASTTTSHLHRMSSSFCAAADPTGGQLFLRASFARSLREFASDPSQTYSIIHTIPSTPNQPSPSRPISDLSTLYVLDSSFNPPTKAHLTIARNAILKDERRRDGPMRMVFLLATENADKKPKPALFEDRLVMMAFCAEELRASLREVGSSTTGDSSSSSSSTVTNGGGHSQSGNLDLSVDIAVTKYPFFMDKALSIDQSGIYSDAQQVHLTGYDTLIRIFNSKYYPSDKKLRVLEPFLSKHRLRVCYRVSDDGAGRDEQERYVAGIGDGSRGEEGMKREWSDMVDLVDDAREVEGVSSTRARKAAVEAEWEELEDLTGVKTAEYVMGQDLYDGETVKKSYD